MDENFLLNTPVSRRLYHECAAELPIIDYHNHLCVADLAGGRKYENLAQLWVVSDPYKHRAMRICGVEEKYITGGAADYEKYEAWMSTLPRLIGNPLYDWSVLEMKRIFDLELDPETADAERIWEDTCRKLAGPDYSAPALLDRFHVEYAAPCASVAEELSGFLQFEHVAPSLRGDDMVNVTAEAIEKLSAAADMPVHNLEEYYAAIAERLQDFEEAGCKFADHALDHGFRYYRDDGWNARRFQDILRGMELPAEETGKLASDILRFLSSSYAKQGWTMQLHIGAQRFTSSRLRSMAGPAGGFAGIGSCCDVGSLTEMLDDFEQGMNGLPDIVLYTLNPADNAVMSVLSGSYSQDGRAGKVQQGPAWWWCDHLYGIREVLENISSFGVLSVFIGMTTDSRSILSFVRHEYFRRAFCGWLGEKVENGRITASWETLKKLVEDVCYDNARSRIRRTK